jgi:hypothetical protein
MIEGLIIPRFDPFGITRTVAPHAPPNSANRVASSREHTWCSSGIICLASHVAGSARTQAETCRASSFFILSCYTPTHCTEVRHRLKGRDIVA